ncbi:hypothetical protein ES332_A01G104300v1 [Gossypium tomentosum]|uniref:Uncharacterized protein n=1 Tax=Gossypium tomentosum TaxID=34277 RepID=A0A5D2RR36_GOSTO|nr:hypothetical protein ES332_A01G104300v1 [Gossypium tomentosum]TYI42518.1 hypothetical protein ES332_A01G104300v1 [Gossypium tomentosum]TYI42519.1 hypothetical protein ES332_A01G104300v1 [Gossypium tomentosum]
MAWLKHLAMLFIGSLCIHGYLLPFLLKLIGDQTSMNGGVEKERGCNSASQETEIPFNNFLYCWNKS